MTTDTNILHLYKKTNIDLVGEVWERYSQRIHFQWPAGFGSHAALQSQPVMCESAFIEAVRDLFKLNMQGKFDAPMPGAPTPTPPAQP